MGRLELERVLSTPTSQAACRNFGQFTDDMSLYHEAASVLGPDAVVGGNLRSRVFNNKDLKSPPGQVYALALETCKWSSILSEVIDNSQLLQHEKKVSKKS